MKYKKINIELWPEAYNYASMGKSPENIDKEREKDSDGNYVYYPFGKPPLRPVPVEFINRMKRRLPQILDNLYQEFDHESEHLEGNAADWMVEWMEEDLQSAISDLIFDFAGQFGLLTDEKEI